MYAYGPVSEEAGQFQLAAESFQEALGTCCSLNTPPIIPSFPFVFYARISVLRAFVRVKQASCLAEALEELSEPDRALPYVN